jgi:hypothetical protein
MWKSLAQHPLPHPQYHAYESIDGTYNIYLFEHFLYKLKEHGLSDEPKQTKQHPASCETALPFFKSSDKPVIFTSKCQVLDKGARFLRSSDVQVSLP